MYNVYMAQGGAAGVRDACARVCGAYPVSLIVPTAAGALHPGQQPASRFKRFCLRISFVPWSLIDRGELLGMYLKI
jgi:hypothetical protein